MKAKISEIFDSVQGEGPYLGIRQIFLRFSGCNINCKFCDTKLFYFEEYSAEELFKKLKRYKRNYHSLAVTGGEPLAQDAFLKKFLPLVKKTGTKIYLETNATLPDKLSGIIDYVDFIAMDIKLPSSTGQKAYWKEHRQFLSLAASKDVFVKAVVCSSSAASDLEKAVKIIRQVSKDIPFVIQPNAFEDIQALADKINDFKDRSLRFLSNVRIIPQMHKLTGVR